jgi:chorismate synthase
MAKVDQARARGTSVGGVFEILVVDPPVGLGSYVHWDRRLDGRLAQALMSIQAIKGVEVGLGFETARRFGFEVHDEIFYKLPGQDPVAAGQPATSAPGHSGNQETGQPNPKSAIRNPQSGEGQSGNQAIGQLGPDSASRNPKSLSAVPGTAQAGEIRNPKSSEGGFVRGTNYAGGLEGGMTNGQPIVLRAAMKPLSTQYTPLASVDVVTKEASKAGVERSDITAVPAAGVVGEAVVAFEIARALCEKFGGDSLAEMRRNYAAYLTYLKTV